MVSQGTPGGVSRCPSTDYIETFFGKYVFFKNGRMHISEIFHLPMELTDVNEGKESDLPLLLTFLQDSVATRQRALCFLHALRRPRVSHLVNLLYESDYQQPVP